MRIASVARALGGMGVLLSWAACGGEDEAIVYQPHTVLALATEIDADGAPDIADPHVIRVDGTWHLYATQNKRDLRVWTSRDLRTWEARPPVWTPTTGTWNARGQAWAPHVEATPDGYFLYYTANMQIGVARSDSPLGPFVEVFDHPLVGGGHGGVGDGVFAYDPGDEPWDRVAAFIVDFDEYAIDAFLLRRDGAPPVLYWSQYRPQSVIHGRVMKDWTTLGDEPAVSLVAPEEPWEGLVAEGVFVASRDGRHHLMYSGNAADRSEYAVGVATADDPLGPFTKDPRNPILRADPARGFFGPGHHGLVEGALDDVLMFYHTKVSADPGFDRRIRYVPVAWDAEGRPGLAVPPP